MVNKNKYRGIGMKKLLYISDLDGTLLNCNKEIPAQAVKEINELLVQDQIHFSVATARTPATVENILEDVRLQEKIVVMNGAALYDLDKHQYVEIMQIPEESIKTILDRCKTEIEEGFIYTIHDHKLLVYYEDLTMDARYAFFEERQNLKYKTFVKGKPNETGHIIYFVFIDTKEKIQAIADKMEGISGIAMVLYKDIYSEAGWILEVYSEKATKANGVRRIKALGQYDEVVAFGDNLNDLPMFCVADRCYAVSNAVEEVKAQATGIIDSSEEGSVPKFISKEIKDRI